MNFDRELIVKAAEGDESARETLVRQFSPLVFRLISRFFQRREDVEDLAQDVFLRVFDRFDQVQPDQNFPGWLSRVTINVCYDQLRKIRRRREGIEHMPKSNDWEAPPESDPYGRIRGALDSLDPKLRIPLVLKEVEELSVAQVSRLMGITQTNVKVRLFRARKKMAQLLVEAGVRAPLQAAERREG